MDRRRRRPKELEEGPFLGLIKREATKSYRSADRSAPLESCVQRVAGVIGAHLGSIPSNHPDLASPDWSVVERSHGPRD